MLSGIISATSSPPQCAQALLAVGTRDSGLIRTCRQAKLRQRARSKALRTYGSAEKACFTNESFKNGLLGAYPLSKPSNVYNSSIWSQRLSRSPLRLKFHVSGCQLLRYRLGISTFAHTPACARATGSYFC